MTGVLHMSLVGFARLILGTLLYSLVTTSGVAPQVVGPQLDVRLPMAPSPVPAKDQIHLVYELHVTNLSRQDGRLTRVEVSDADGARGLGAYSGATLAENVWLVGPTETTTSSRGVELGAGETAIVFMWLSLEPDVVPSAITHRITYQPDSPARPPTQITTDPQELGPDPVVIAPPLRGGDWMPISFGPPNSEGHRRSMYTVAGRATIAQRFGTDWSRWIDGMSPDGGFSLRSNNVSYSWGQEVLAVADGIVTETVDGIPDNEPDSRAVEINMETLAGNYVLLDIGSGRYALYGHLQAGLPVAKGDSVRVGDVLGLVGNSGNSVGPHLHFHMVDGPSPFGAEGVPFVIRSFDITGRPFDTERPTFPPERHEFEMPLASNQLVRFPGN